MSGEDNDLSGQQETGPSYDVAETTAILPPEAAEHLTPGDPDERDEYGLERPEKRYGLSKPRRVVIRARIVRDEG